MASSSSRTKAQAASSSRVGKDVLSKNAKLTRADFDKRQPICEMAVEFQELDNAYPGLMAMFEVQGWITAMSSQHELVSPFAVREFYYNMDRVNKFHMNSKVGPTKFVLKSSLIAEYLQVTEDGDDTYFDNIRQDQFLSLVSEDELHGMVIQSGVPYKNPVHTSTLTPMAYVVWQILVANVLPQTGHVTELSNFALYTIHGILTGKKINLPFLILNHTFRCRNQKRASLPFGRMITGLMQRASLKIKSSELYNSPVKSININTFVCRGVLRGVDGKYTYVQLKKRKIDQPPSPGSPSNDPPTQQEGDDPLAYIDDLELSPSHEEGERAPPAGMGGVTLDAVSQQLSDMHWSFQRFQSRQDRILRNQERMVQDLSAHFSFDTSRYEFGSPQPSPPHE